VGKVLVDISNPITPDYKALTVGHTTSAAEEIQKLAPQANVVEAYNTIFAELLPADARKGRAVQVFVAGDDEAAKKVVSDMVTKGDFEAVESGPLSNCRYLEPVGEINIHFGFFLDWGTSAAPAWTKGRFKSSGGVRCTAVVPVKGGIFYSQMSASGQEQTFRE
jgi:predicted dinucleotide-binding enzyme